jgi:hypothetical protein
MLLAIDAQEKRMQVTPICSFSWHAAIFYAAISIGTGVHEEQKLTKCTKSKKRTCIRPTFARTVLAAARRRGGVWRLRRGVAALLAVAASACDRKPDLSIFDLLTLDLKHEKTVGP